MESAEPDAPVVHVRAYEPADHDAVARIWQEIGWISDDKEQVKAVGEMAAQGRTSVALVNGVAESFGAWMPATVTYTSTDLSLCHITAITTSRLGRRRGFASTMTERCLAEGAAEGFAVASLGVFDEGFYDRFGFGTGTPVAMVKFDPASLRVDVPYRTPERLGAEHADEMQAAMANRLAAHGAMTMGSASFYGWDFVMEDRYFALGYRDDSGRLTHYVAGAPSAQFDSYEIYFFAYETTDQLLELLRLVADLADQAVAMTIIEPAHVRVQDLIERPRRQNRRSRGGEFQTGLNADSWWQIRIIDLYACVAARSWVGPPVQFNLRLRDPLAESVTSTWDGIGGDYTIVIGEDSTVEAGHTSGLAVLDASVGAFTRMWLGVMPASELTITDDLGGPPDLLAQLDQAFCLPTPKPGIPL